MKSFCYGLTPTGYAYCVRQNSENRRSLINREKKKKQSKKEFASKIEPEVTPQEFKVDYKVAASDALDKVQQELPKGKVEQNVKLGLDNNRMDSTQ